MFQLVCMFMHFKPGDAEGVAEKIFSKVMAVGNVSAISNPNWVNWISLERLTFINSSRCIRPTVA